jgi:hypothetical protein
VSRCSRHMDVLVERTPEQPRRLPNVLTPRRIAAAVSLALLALSLRRRLRYAVSVYRYRRQLRFALSLLLFLRRLRKD